MPQGTLDDVRKRSKKRGREVKDEDEDEEKRMIASVNRDCVLSGSGGRG